jgi:dienelactone hydrolase
MNNRLLSVAVLAALLFSGSAPAHAQSTPPAAPKDGSFTNASLQGNYALTGFVGANVAAIVGVCHFDGNGHFNCSYTGNAPGEAGTRKIFPITDKGDYTVNADGTGTIHEFETVEGVTSEYHHNVVVIAAEARGTQLLATEIAGLVDQTDDSGALYTSHYNRLPDAAAGSTAAPALDQAVVQQAYDQLAGARAAYSARERMVEFQHEGQKIVGTLTLPDGGEAPYPVVLFFQGFLSTRDELPVTGVDEPLFTRTARMLAELGIASLRIDYRGFGESEGKREDLTFTGLIDDSLAAIEYLATVPEVDMQRLGLLGLSVGGIIAAETAARDPRVRSVVLWSPVANPPEYLKSTLGTETVAAGLQSGGEPVHAILPWGEEIDLKTPFFEDVYSINPVAAMSTVKSPLLMVVGRNDADVTPQPQYGQLYLNYHAGDERLVAVDGDHIFDVMSERGPEVLDDVIAWSLAWLLQTL